MVAPANGAGKAPAAIDWCNCGRSHASDRAPAIAAVHRVTLSKIRPAVWAPMARRMSGSDAFPRSGFDRF